jgi:hypothetical protein
VGDEEKEERKDVLFKGTAIQTWEDGILNTQTENMTVLSYSMEDSSCWVRNTR